MKSHSGRNMLCIGEDVTQMIDYAILLLFTKIGTRWKTQSALEKICRYINTGLMRKKWSILKQGLQVHRLPDRSCFYQMPLKRFHYLVAAFTRI